MYGCMYQISTNSQKNHLEEYIDANMKKNINKKTKIRKTKLTNFELNFPLLLFHTAFELIRYSRVL